jgi:curved DNA-binding protein CbpA
MDSNGGGSRQEERILRLAPDFDPRDIDLTPVEGFVLSRIDGRTSWKTLRQMGGGLEPDEVDRILERFREFGVLASGEAARSEAKPSEARRNDRVRAEADAPPRIDASLGISVEAQKSILGFEAKLAAPYHEILGVAANADVKDIKRAYFRLSREYHPDRYFRRNTGAFAARLDRIFKKIAEAYELLSDPNTRAEIERSLASMPPAQPAASSGEYRNASQGSSERIGPEPRGYRKPSRMENLERLRSRFAPPKRLIAERRVKANQLFQAARVSAHQGRFLEAAAGIRLAIAFDPWNDDYKKGFGEIQAQVQAARATELFEQARNASGAAEALPLLEEALNYRPYDVAMLTEAVQICLSVRDLAHAQDYATQLCELEPESAVNHARLAGVLRRRGQRQNALAALEKARKIDPQHPDVKAEQLEQRRGLLRQPGGTA